MPARVARLARPEAVALLWVVLVWGSGWLAIKVALGSFAPLFLAGSRQAVTVLLMWQVARAAGAAWPRDRAEWRTLLGTGALMAGVCPGLVFLGQERVPSGLASLLFAAMPLFTLLLADRFLPGEPLTRGRLSGILVGLAGVAVVSGAGLAGDGFDPAGAAAVLLGAAIFSAGLVWMKRATAASAEGGARFHPLVVVAAQSAAGGLVLLPMSIATEPEPIRQASLFAAAMYAYLTLVQSCLTQSVYFWLVKRVDATRIAYISCVVPAIAVLAGAFALGEPVGWTIALGGAGVVAGLYLVNRPARGARRADQR
ncbi:MAG TPA: EamA family transporter [Chloroflexota bacterium]|jgi:drug/metabolite transporter (DMT)-like permease|nr:EamA family transporter [Chloroflexota bacterium]